MDKSRTKMDIDYELRGKELNKLMGSTFKLAHYETLLFEEEKRTKALVCEVKTQRNKVSTKLTIICVYASVCVQLEIHVADTHFNNYSTSINTLHVSVDYLLI